jgi:hypothetical protein
LMLWLASAAEQLATSRATMVLNIDQEERCWPYAGELPRTMHDRATVPECTAHSPLHGWNLCCATLMWNTTNMIAFINRDYGFGLDGEDLCNVICSHVSSSEIWRILSFRIDGLRKPDFEGFSLYKTEPVGRSGKYYGTPIAVGRAHRSCSCGFQLLLFEFIITRNIYIYINDAHNI